MLIEECLVAPVFTRGRDRRAGKLFRITMAAAEATGRALAHDTVLGGVQCRAERLTVPKAHIVRVSRFAHRGAARSQLLGCRLFRWCRSDQLFITAEGAGTALAKRAMIFEGGRTPAETALVIDVVILGG